MVLCFLAAAVFWIFNSFNKSYSTDIQFPLRFIYDEEVYVTKTIPSHLVNLNVTGIGWDLFRKSLAFNIPTLNIELERPSEIGYLIGNNLMPVFSGQLGNLKINYVNTDTLFVAIEERIARRFILRVAADSIQFRNGYGLDGLVEIVPQTVELIGPVSILQALPDTINLFIPKNDIHKNYSDEVEVPLFSNEFIKRNPPQVRVSFQVIVLKKVDVAVRLIYSNVPEGLHINTNEMYQVLVEIPEGKEEEFKKSFESLKAKIDLGNLKKADGHKILPTIFGMPAYARVSKMDSVVINF